MQRLAKNHFTVTKKVLVTGVVFCVLITGGLVYQTQKANAVAGINRTINFQGKLVSNPAKTNVSNTSYTVVFTFYDRASGGTVLWQETQTVTTYDGIFRVNLGSITPIPANFNFNWDGIYLGMKVGTDSEMTPRIQMAAVPYAFNAEKVSGLTVQDANGNASTSGTLRIANNKTINLGTDNLVFTTGGDTTLTLPSTGTLSTLAGVEILTNKTIGSTGLAFSGATTDITSATNEDLTITPNGTGNLILGGDGDSSVTIGSATSAEFPLLVRSGISNLASFVVDNLNSGNLFSASSSGSTKFTIGANGEIGLGLLAGLPNFGSTNNCLISNGTGAGASWSTCAAGTNLWQLNGNVISQNNNTYDVLFGSNATSTARFAFIGNAGNASPVASISANTNGAYAYLSGAGNLGTTNKQSLTLGGITTGLINILNSAGNTFAIFDTLNSRLGIGTSTPLAALDVNGSASIAGAMTFYTTPQIQSTARQTLTLGGNTTGSIQFNPGGLTSPNLFLKNNGDIGINTSNPLATFDLRANTANSGGTLAVASISGTTSFASLLVDQRGAGDIFSASIAGVPKFTITNAGGIKLGQNEGSGGDCLLSTGAGLEVTWGDCGGIAGADVLYATADLGNVTITNAATYLNSVTITPSNSTGDVLVRANVWTRSLSATDQTITVQIREANVVNCAGNVLSSGTASLVSANGANGPAVFASYLETNPGNSTIEYEICALTTVVNGAAAGGQASAEVIDGGTAPGYASFWNLFDGTGVISPVNSTADLLLGGTGTGSAKFAVLGLAGTTPIASLSAQNVSGQAIYIDAANGLISTVRNATLTLGGGASGNVQINPLGAALFSVGTSAPLASVDLRYSSGTNRGGTTAVASVSGTTSFAALVANNSGLGDLLTASKSGASKFVVQNNGNLRFAGTTNFLSTIASAATASRTWTMPDADGTVCLQNSTSCGFLTGTNYLQLNSNVLSQNNNTYDVMFGGTATETARFAFIGNAGNATPVASISAQNAAGQAMYLDVANGTLSTLRNQTLTLGGGTTGNVQINPLGGALFSIGSGSPLASIDLRYASTFRGGTLAVASVSGTTSFAALMVDNNGVGDLFTASKSGARKFVITNNGDIQFAGSTNFLSTISSAATSSQTWTLPNASGTICVSGNNCNGGLGQWFYNAGAISANNAARTDLLIGGISTSSAVFSVTGLSSITNQTQASLSGKFTLMPNNGYGGDASISGKLVLGAFSNATIETTNAQTLTIGGLSTGNILINPQSVDRVGIGTSTPLADLHINGGASTVAAASVSAQTSFASLVIDQRGVGDIFTASTGGIPRFSITNTGGIKIGELQGALGECLKSGGAGASLSWGTCGGGGAAGTWNIDPLGTHYSINTTLNTLFGGTSTSSAKVNIAGSLTGGKAAMIINQLENQDIFTASSSGAPRFALGANGEIKVGSAGNLSSGISGQCLISAGSGAAVSWGGCASGAGAGWFTLQSAQGTLYPVNTTLDFLIGGTSTSSAKFGILNSAGSNAPIASLSATTASGGDGSGLVFDSGTVSIQSLRDETLTIGGNTTGSIQFSAGGNSTLFLKANGDIGTGTNNNDPRASFDIRANTSNGGGTVAVASVSGKTSFAALVVNNSGTGDLFTASSEGQTRFRMTNNGSVNFGGDYVSASNTAKLTNNGSPSTINALGDQGSLVPNASFEANSINPGLADGWVVAATSSGLVTSDASTASHGDRSMRVQMTNNSAAFYSACFPISTEDTSSYALAFNWRVTAAPIPTLRANMATYTSKANCNNNSAATFTNFYSTTAITANASWQPSNTTAGQITLTTAGDRTWGRIQFFVACTTNCTNSTINIDGVKLDMAVINSGGLDVAENYTGDPENLAQPGDVVKLAKRDGKTVVVPADSVYGKDVIGVVTTKPGLLLDDEIDGPKVPVVLAGRIPVKVSTVNGVIKTGDKLTSSSIPGVAVKAVKSGQIIGTAMEDYQGEEVGEIVVHFNLQTSQGSIKDSYENVRLESNNFGQEVLDAIKAQENQGLSGSEIVTDRLIANVEIVTPKLTVSELHAKKIVAEQIEGLSEYDSRLAALEEKVATLSANLQNQKTISVQVEYATISSQLVENNTKIEQQNKLMKMISEQLASSSASSNYAVSKSSQVSSLEDNLRVKGNALIEGVLNIVDSIITNNLIVNGLATFFGDAVFKSNTSFEDKVTFNNDIGGNAVINKNEDKVRVDFEKDFDETPILNASVSFDEIKDEKGNLRPLDEVRDAYFKENYEYIIVDKSKSGFVIVLNKKAVDDITFTWTALRVKNPRNIQSRKPD